MCVIAIIENEDKKPSMEDLQRMETANPDRAGIAWIEGSFVKWKKDLSAGEIYNIQRKLPAPYIIHFRLASVGGRSPLLCHPFPVTLEAETSLEGAINGRVLFHNGHWAKWRDYCLEAVIKTGKKFPESGPYSDTRAIAWLVSVYGTGILPLLGEKVAVISSTAGAKHFGEGWQLYKGYLVSNTLFTKTPKEKDWDLRSWTHGKTHWDPFSKMEK